jgi:hypothetical protein
LIVNIGLPGTGIAGIFYVLAALWMPFRALLRALRGERDAARWRLALTGAALASCIIAATAATVWAIDLLASLGPAPNTAGPTDDAGGAAGATAAGAIHTFGVAPGLVTLVTLAALVLLLELAALVVTRRRRRPTPRSA